MLLVVGGRGAKWTEESIVLLPFASVAKLALIRSKPPLLSERVIKYTVLG